MTEFVHKDMMVAGHFFSSRSEDTHMNVIFEKQELDRIIDKSDAGKSELFKAVNEI